MADVSYDVWGETCSATRDEFMGAVVWWEFSYAVRDAVEGAVWDEVWVVRGAVGRTVGENRKELFDQVRDSDG